MIVVLALATSHSASIVRPCCSECGTATFLVGIEPERPGYELRTFQCPKCEHFETAIGKPGMALVAGAGRARGRYH